MDVWYISLYNSELYNGSLLLAEREFRLLKCRKAYKYIIMNLYKLGFYTKILDMLQDESLSDYHIRLVYYKCIEKTNLPCKNTQSFTPEFEDLSSENVLDKTSVEVFWESFTKKDILRKELLIKSYRLDIRNVECLYFLIKEEMCTEKELANLMNDQKILREIFSPYISEFYHPFYAFLCSKYFFIEKDVPQLFNVSHVTYRLYKDCVFTYLSLALYFMLIKDYEEGKRILLKSLEFDKSSGQIYLYLGICYSKLRECEKSLSCFNISNKKMVCTWKSYYYLAHEYQKMTNFDKARFYYIEGLQVERDIKIQEGYVSLLIFCEDYKEALSYISSIIRSKEANKSNNILLLKCYCHLFLGNIEESRRALEKCAKDFRYFCTKGYIEHLTNNVDSACDLYNKSLLLKHSLIIEELMSSAIKRNKENDVYNSCTELFEYIFISVQEIEVI